jgi:hypothetical protein
MAELRNLLLVPNILHLFLSFLAVFCHLLPSPTKLPPPDEAFVYWHFSRLVAVWQ